jgi:digeranylgeranylglycerophospholipid reductase
VGGARAHDLIVVGAGPAGSTAARYAARRGLKVLLLDRRKVVGVPVQCGEYVATNEEVRAIFPTVTELEDLMAAPYKVRQRDTDVLRLWSPAGRHWDVPFRGFTVCRDLMDQGIADQAVAEGAELRTSTTCLKVAGNEVVTDRGTFAAKVIVGADGPSSRVAKSVGLPSPVTGPAMSCNVPGDFDSVTDLWFGSIAPGGYAWVIPKDGEANVGLGAWQHFDGNLGKLFESFLRAHGWPVVRGTGGHVPVLGPVARTVAPPVILVGDAAGHVMATNGGGINVSMVCGRIAGLAAADHVQGGVPLEAYETRWRAAVGGPLAQGAKIKTLADRFFTSDRRLNVAMRLIGRRRMARAIRCQSLLSPGRGVAKAL